MPDLENGLIGWTFERMFNFDRPCGERGDEGLSAWQLGDTRYLLDQAQEAVASGRIGDSILLRHIRQTVLSDRCLFRGVRVSPDDPLMSAPVGSCFDLLPSSFTRDVAVAAGYSATPIGIEPQRWVPLLLVLKRSWNHEDFGPLRGFDMEGYLTSLDGHGHTHREVICAGRFRILEALPYAESGRLLVIRTQATYGIPTGWNETK